MEDHGLRPVPIFINGVEAHTVVRDQLTTEHEKGLLRSGIKTSPTLLSDAVMVDAVVNTIGFPLVGGPAGTMEGGRQAEVAKAILQSKNVPYVVAAPLLIQDMATWVRDGIGGLQSVVLYSLPELDGAIDTVPLGGLVGDNIYLVPERVTRLAGRLQKWISLRKTPAAERKLAIVMYGFPPGVGAAGTAALLNVPKSLEAMLGALREEGYNLGDLSPDVDGEAIVAALRTQAEEAVVARGAAGVVAHGAGPAAQFGVQAVATDIPAARLKEMLTYPDGWGPTEWGPIPFLPEPDILVRKMEGQWGDLSQYRSGLSTSTSGASVVAGLQFGNVFIGVQPLLGVEGDPMRLLFERDLTPHPQYAAFYKWLQASWKASPSAACNRTGAAMSAIFPGIVITMAVFYDVCFFHRVLLSRKISRPMPCCTLAPMAPPSGCQAPLWATAASPGQTSSWETSPTSTFTPPTTHQSPSWPSAGATAPSCPTTCRPTAVLGCTNSWPSSKP